MANPINPILILTTGGTIDKAYFDALSQYQVGESVVQRMLVIARVSHPYLIQEVLRKDSLELTDADRDTLVAHVQRSPARRIVITHGTDTMTQTAERLEKMTAEEAESTARKRTIVLTGSLSPARFSESDATFNLGMAFATAQMAPAGIFIAMNGNIFPAALTQKDRERSEFVLK